MKILLCNRKEENHVGGDMIQLRAYQRAFEKMGHTVDYKWELNIDAKGYDYAIMFHCNFGWNLYHYVALRRDKIPYSVVAIYYPRLYSDTDQNVMWGILSNSQNIFCLSPKERDELLEEFPSVKDKVLIVDNGVDKSIFNKSEAPRETFVLAASGRVGKGEKEVEEACKELGLEFKFVTGVSQTELANYYRKCKVYVCGSDGERNNLMVLEAAACGATVVDSVYNRAYPVHGFSYVGDPKNKEQFKESIFRAYNNPVDESDKVKSWDDVVEFVIKNIWL